MKQAANILGLNRWAIHRMILNAEKDGSVVRLGSGNKVRYAFTILDFTDVKRAA